MDWTHRQRLVWGFLGFMFALFVAASLAGGFYVDWLWFTSLGYADVFWRSLAGRWLVGSAGGVVFGGLLLVNLWLALRDAPLLAGAVPFPYQRWFRLRPLMLVVAALALLHGLAEGTSLSRVIERVPILAALDRWGRDGDGRGG